MDLKGAECLSGVYSTAVRIAEILYSANPDTLLEDVAIKHGQNSCSTSTKDDNKIVDTTIMIMNASKKH